MALVGIRTKVSVDAKSFWHKTITRLESNDVAKNPFDAKVKMISDELVVVDIKPIYPPFFILGFFPFFLGLIMSWSFVTLIGVIIMSIGFLWTKYFFYLMIFFGLRKEGYKGKVILVNHGALVRELIGNGTD